MNTWIGYLIAYSQIVVIYFLMPAFYARRLMPMFEVRNRDWVAANRLMIATKLSGRIAPWLLYAFGTVWIALLVHYQISAADQHLGAVLILPTMVWFLPVLAYLGEEYWRIGRHIPLPAKRTASLERRTLRTFVNPAWVWLCYGLFAAFIAAYCSVYALDWISHETFTRRMYGTAMILVLSTPVLIYGVMRKDQPGDDLWGPSSRKYEIRFYVLTLYGGLAVIGMRLLEDLSGLTLLDTVTFFMAVNLLFQTVQLGVMIRLRRYNAMPLPRHAQP